MPSWKLHKKWVEVMGISKEISQEVNELIDFGEAGHDAALGKPEI